MQYSETLKKKYIKNVMDKKKEIRRKKKNNDA